MDDDDDVSQMNPTIEIGVRRMNKAELFRDTFDAVSTKQCIYMCVNVLVILQHFSFLIFVFVFHEDTKKI